MFVCVCVLCVGSGRVGSQEELIVACASFPISSLSRFQGGGIWTAASLPLIAKAGLWPTFVICTLVFLAWVGLFWFHFRPGYGKMCRCTKCAELRENGLLSDQYTADDYDEISSNKKAASEAPEGLLARNTALHVRSPELAINSSGSDSERWVDGRRPLSVTSQDVSRRKDEFGLAEIVLDDHDIAVSEHKGDGGRSAPR